MESSVDLGLPILYFIMVFWGLFAIAAVLISLTKDGRFPGKMNKVLHKFQGPRHHDKRKNHSSG